MVGKKDNTKSVAVKTAEKLFASFLKEHPNSSIKEIDIEKKGETQKRLIINNPWGDSSLVFFLPEDAKPIANILKQVYLPERLTALWHKDLKQLEIIYTAYKIDEIAQREFVVRFKSVEYSCEFAPSSSRLMELAKIHRASAESKTEYRNLRSFQLYSSSKENPEVFDWFGLGEPTSFWIKNFSEWNEDKIIDFVLHLNFYMGYFDTDTPVILTHSPKTEDPEFKAAPRFATGRFPANINAREIDTHLLHYWHASLNGDSSRRFTYCYRIIEYAAFSHIDSETRTEIRRALALPHAIDNIEGTIDDVVNILKTVHKNWENEKIESFLIEKINPSVLWKEISRNRKIFERDMILDGGFVIPALIKDRTDEAVFEGCGVSHFAGTIRKIRNALSHGREQQRLSVITPTHSNFERLESWASLMAVAANEVMIFKGVITATPKKTKKEQVKEKEGS